MTACSYCRALVSGALPRCTNCGAPTEPARIEIVPQAFGFGSSDPATQINWGLAYIESEYGGVHHGPDAHSPIEHAYWETSRLPRGRPSWDELNRYARGGAR